MIEDDAVMAEAIGVGPRREQMAVDVATDGAAGRWTAPPTVPPGGARHTNGDRLGLPIAAAIAAAHRADLRARPLPAGGPEAEVTLPAPAQPRRPLAIGQ